MSVAPVDGYGPITQSNAAEIYKNREVYNKLDDSQKRLVDRYVPEEEREQIDYDMRSTDAKKSGKDKINRSEEAEKGKNNKQGGNVTGVTGGNMASVAATTALANVASISDGFTAVILSIAAAACAAASIIVSKAFDSEYGNRKATKGDSSSTNETLDAQNAALQSSMDMMDEDYQAYMDGSKTLMQDVNGNNSKLADLNVQLADAQAAGDKTGAESLKSQIEKYQNTDFSKSQDALEEKRKGIDDYRTMGTETDGVIEGGTSVSEFLKQGNELGALATVNTAILVLGVAAMYMCSTSHCPKIWAMGIPIDGAASIGAKITYALCGAMFSWSAAIMGDKAKNEFECHSAGVDVSGHVDALTSMQEQQSAYTDATEEGYTEEDEERTENITEGEQMANENSVENGGALINKKHKTAAKKGAGKDDDDNKDGNGSGSGSKQTAGAAA